MSHLIGFVVEKMNKLLGPSLSRMMAPFFLLAILASKELTVLWCQYEISQLPHTDWNCQLRRGARLWLWWWRGGGGGGHERMLRLRLNLVLYGGSFGIVGWRNFTNFLRILLWFWFILGFDQFSSFLHVIFRALTFRRRGVFPGPLLVLAAVLVTTPLSGTSSSLGGFLVFAMFWFLFSPMTRVWWLRVTLLALALGARYFLSFLLRMLWWRLDTFILFVFYLL